MPPFTIDLGSAIGRRFLLCPTASTTFLKPCYIIPLLAYIPANVKNKGIFMSICCLYYSLLL